MHIYVNGRNIEITDAIKSYVKEKIGKVANHYDQIQGIEVVLSVIKNPSASGKHVAEVLCKTNSGTAEVGVGFPEAFMVRIKHVAEVLCKTNSGTIKAEEAAESMYASIDLLADKLDRQVKKLKDKNLGSDKSSIRTDSVEEVEAEKEEETFEE